MRFFYYVRVAALVFIVIVQEVQSQTLQQIALLEQMAQDCEAVWYAERAAAESWAISKGYPITVIDSSGVVIELHRVVDGIPYYYNGLNLGAAKTISTNKVWPGGGFGFALDGNTADTLAMWDKGKVRNTHQEFQPNRVTQADNVNLLNDHATHVAGTMVASGYNPLAKGMAYNSFLKAYGWGLDESEMS